MTLMQELLQITSQIHKTSSNFQVQTCPTSLVPVTNHTTLQTKLEAKLGPFKNQPGLCLNKAKAEVLNCSKMKNAVLINA